MESMWRASLSKFLGFSASGIFSFARKNLPSMTYSSIPLSLIDELLLSLKSSSSTLLIVIPDKDLLSGGLSSLLIFYNGNETMFWISEFGSSCNISFCELLLLSLKFLLLKLLTNGNFWFSTIYCRYRSLLRSIFLHWTDWTTFWNYWPYWKAFAIDFSCFCLMDSLSWFKLTLNDKIDFEISL